MSYTARFISAVSVFCAISLIAVTVRAQSADPALPVIGQLSLTPTPEGPTYESHNGTYLDAHGWLSTTNDSTIKLTNGLSVDFVSSFSQSNILAGHDNAYTLNPAGGLYGTPGQISPFNTSAIASTFGGRASMDIGGGLSLNVSGSLGRIQDPTLLAQRGMLGFGSNGALSSEARAGITMDFGNGSSLSLSGGVSRTPGGVASCGLLPMALCR